jgi:hypothetical protein
MQLFIIQCFQQKIMAMNCHRLSRFGRLWHDAPSTQTKFPRRGNIVVAAGQTEIQRWTRSGNRHQAGRGPRVFAGWRRDRTHCGQGGRNLRQGTIRKARDPAVEFGRSLRESCGRGYFIYARGGRHRPRRARHCESPNLPLPAGLKNPEPRKNPWKERKERQKKWWVGGDSNPGPMP